MLKQLFWSTDDRRITMLWRIILQTLLLALLSLVLTTPLVLIGAAQAGMSLQDVLFFGSEGRFAPAIALALLLANTVGLLGSVWLAGRLLDRRVFTDFGLHFNRNWWVDLGFGLALGAFLMLVIFVVELGAGWVVISATFDPGSNATVFELPGDAFVPAILIQLVLFIFVGIQEELWTRGYHLKNVAEGFAALSFIGSRAAIIISLLLSSAIFGMLHATNPNASATSTFNIFLAGIFLALGYLLTGELAIPIGIHITWNFFQGNVFGFPVSGLNAGPSFIAIQQRGTQLITGGNFGPEAGLIGVGAILLGSLLLVAWVRMRSGALKIENRLAVATYLPRRQRKGVESPQSAQIQP